MALLQKCQRIFSAPLLAALLIFCLYLLIASRSTLWDRDEPRYTSVTVEMVRSGNYLVPTLEGKAWPDKPVLLYWLMSIPVRLFGPSELACRFWAAVGSAITCILTYAIGKRLFIILFAFHFCRNSRFSRRDCPAIHCGSYGCLYRRI
jgi:4-amino-4-deoxy-L-arabinose transferase-like glycosyltransferase